MPRWRPTRTTPAATQLRDTRWDRLKDSLLLNGERFVSLIVQGVTSAGALKELTAREWPQIRSALDTGTAVPVGLVGTSISPTDQHEVVAIDYDDHEDGTGVLYLYEPNGPDQWQSIAFDLNGPELSAWESTYEDGQDVHKGPLPAFSSSSTTRSSRPRSSIPRCERPRVWPRR